MKITGHTANHSAPPLSLLAPNSNAERWEGRDLAYYELLVLMRDVALDLALKL